MTERTQAKATRVPELKKQAQSTGRPSAWNSRDRLRGRESCGAVQSQPYMERNCWRLEIFRVPHLTLPCSYPSHSVRGKSWQRQGKRFGFRNKLILKLGKWGRTMHLEAIVPEAPLEDRNVAFFEMALLTEPTRRVR